MSATKSLLVVVALTAALVSTPAPSTAGAPTAGPDTASTRTVPYPVRAFRPDDRTPPTLRRHWQVWKARHVTHYRTRVLRGCFCPVRPTRVTVVRGHRVVRVDDGPRRPRSRGYEIDRLYRVLQHAYRHADSVDVVWRRGVPVRIGIDPVRLMADEETYYTVRLRDLRRG